MAWTALASTGNQPLSTLFIGK